MIEFKTATREMLDDFHNQKTVRAIAALDKDRVLGVCGLSYSGDGQTIFMQLTEELKKHPRELLKAWKIMLEMIEENNIPTFARCDWKIEKSEKFLLHFGFVPYQDNVWIRR
jgi:hypothetical protein